MSAPVVFAVVLILYILACIRTWRKIGRAERGELPKARTESRKIRSPRPVPPPLEPAPHH